MDLFGNDTTNILPQDGTVEYYGKIFTKKESNYFLECLLNTIVWKHDEAIIFGNYMTTKRKVAWYGDDHYAYRYSNTTKTALLWTKELLELKAMIECKTGKLFNSCLLNLYHNGEEGMAWHSDDEKALGYHTTIASLSFGAARKFSFKHKQTQQVVSVTLENGSLLVMKDATQTHWLHCLPKTKKVFLPRISLTFRTIVLG